MGRKLLKVSFFVVVGLIVLFVVFIEYSTSPQFCNSCHIMEPYYNAWKTSTHNFVPCVDCHYTPGLQSQARSKFEALNQVVSYITRTYGSKPRAEISDWSCLRTECHSQRLLQGKVDFKGINFDHRPHLMEVRRGLKLRCTSCHSQIVQGTHMTVTTSTCFLCHFKGVKIGEGTSKCTSCHPPPEATVEFEGVSFNHKEIVERGIRCSQCHVQVIQGDGNVPRERCLICHGEPQKIEKYDQVQLIHSKHVSEHKIDCEECHNAIQHGLVKMVSSLEVECISCHPDHHSEVKELYMGIGGKGLPANPSSMFMTRVGCKGCHLVHKKVSGIGDVKEANESACIHCHGTRFHGMLDNWKKEIEDGVRSLSASLEKAEGIVSGENGARGYKDAMGSLEVARHNLNVVRQGGGVHNVGYSIDLLRTVYESIRQAVSNVGSSYRPAQPALILATNVKKQGCATCHVGIGPRKLRVFGRDFTHGPHLKAGLDCIGCHEKPEGFTGEPHGDIKISADDCDACHHSGESFQCKGCHADFLNSEIRFKGETFLHEAHLQGTSLRCLDCHRGTKGGKVSVKADLDCYGCHHRESELPCESCHRVQAAFFNGRGVEGVSTDPNPMKDMVGCANCHQGIEGGNSVEQVRGVCDDCHEEGGYAELVNEWQESTKEAMDDVTGDLRDAKERLSESGKISSINRAVLESAEAKVSFVEQDGSGGVHNPALAEELIDAGERELEEILQPAPGE